MYYPTNSPYGPMYPPMYPMDGGMPGGYGMNDYYGGGANGWFFPPQDGSSNSWTPSVNDYGSPYNQPYPVQMSEQEAIEILAKNLEQVDNLPGANGKKRKGLKDGQISESDLKAVLKTDDEDVTQEMKDAAQALLLAGTLKRIDKTEKTVENGPDYEFRKAMETFSDGRSRELMDWLEWNQNHDAAQAHNGRFGTNGMNLLALLTPDSPEWEQGAKDFPPIPKEERQRFIDAAKAALKPENKTLLDQVHGGDGIFEWEDISNWSASHKPTSTTKSAPIDGKISFDTFRNWANDYETNSRRAFGPQDLKKAMDILNASFELFQEGDPNKKTVSWSELQIARNSDNPKYTNQLKAAIQYLEDHKDEFDKLDALDGNQDGRIQQDVITKAIGSGTEQKLAWDPTKTRLEDTTKDENKAAWNVFLNMWDKVDGDHDPDGLIYESDIVSALQDTSGKFTAEEKQALIRIYQLRDRSGDNLWDQVKSKHKRLSQTSLKESLAVDNGCTVSTPPWQR